MFITIDEMIRYRNEQYDNNRQAEKISTLSSDKIDK